MVLGCTLHEARLSCRLQGSERLESNVGLGTYRTDDIYIITCSVQSYGAERRAEEGVRLRNTNMIGLFQNSNPKEKVGKLSSGFLGE